MAFELLNGQPPYTGDRDMIRKGHLSRPVPDVAAGNTVLRNLIMRLLAKDPAERPQDARAVLERLQKAALPRTPIQEAIAKGLGAHASERARETAAEAAAKAPREAEQQLRRQALADLNEIVDDAVEDLQQVDPDIRLDREFGGEETTVTNADAMMRINLWPQGAYGIVSGDTMALAGEVII